MFPDITIHTCMHAYQGHINTLGIYNRVILTYQHDVTTEKKYYYNHS